MKMAEIVDIIFSSGMYMGSNCIL